MKTAVVQRARELGFDACRVTTAAAPDHAAQFEQWLDARHHGEMAYLQRNAHKRIDPQRVLPGARSVVCVAASYSGDKAEKVISNQRPVISDGTKVEALITDDSPLMTGQVARYARFTDYHEVLAERLRTLSAAC